MTCPASALVEDNGTLACHLPEDHAGLHYDAVDEISWKVGRPDD